MREKVFGIDLGTTYSCISRVDEYGRPEVLRNGDGQPTTPSVVLFDNPTEVVVGVQAKRQARIRPDQVASLVKRHMGDGDWRFRVHGQEYSAPAIASQVLRLLAADAERQTGEPVRDVVVTVPAYFGDEERKATKLAGELAGLRVVDIVNEPTAAAFAYGLGAVTGGGAIVDKTVLVYDLGGGTFDTTVIRLSAGRIQVVATDGDHELGGADWDDRLAEHLSRAFVAQCPDVGDPLDDSYGAQDVLNEAEQAKQSLSQRESVDLLVVFGGGRASVTVTRTEFEQLTSALLERTIDLTRKVLAAAAAKGVASVDTVLLVGGMAKMPAVAARLTEAFGVDPVLTDPDLAVAKGAALYGQKKEMEAHVMGDLVARGLLESGSDVSALAGVSSADMSAAVAATAREYGLAADAVSSLVTTEVSNVTSRAFGLLALHDDSQTVQAVFLAHQNDPLPIEVEQTFYTVDDDQDHVRVRVVEQATGVESIIEYDNKVVVEGVIGGIPGGHPRGTPVHVTFSMRRDQTIEVVARHHAVPDPLVLRVEAGVSSASMRAEESAKVAVLQQRA